MLLQPLFLQEGSIECRVTEVTSAVDRAFDIYVYVTEVPLSCSHDRYSWYAAPGLPGLSMERNTQMPRGPASRIGSMSFPSVTLEFLRVV